MFVLDRWIKCKLCFHEKHADLRQAVTCCIKDTLKAFDDFKNKQQKCVK